MPAPEKAERHRTTASWPADTHAAILAYMRREGINSLNEAVTDLVNIGLHCDRRQPRRWTEDMLTFPKDGPRTVVTFTIPEYRAVKTWRHRHEIDVMSDAIVALVERGLEEMGK